MVQTIPVKLEFTEVDPSGETCPFCGDTIYLSAFLVSVYSRRTGEFIQKIPKQICGSCKEVIEQDYCSE